MLQELLKRHRQRKTFRDGCDLLQKGSWTEAEATFRRSIALDSRHTESHHNLGIALLKLTRWEEAGAALQRTIALDSNLLEPHANLVGALLKMSRWEEAIAACRRAIARHPQSAGLHEHLGVALSKVERWGDAADAYQQAVALGATGPGLHASLGHAFLKLERWSEAAAAFRETLSRDTGDPLAAAGLDSALAMVARQEAIAPPPEVVAPPQEPMAPPQEAGAAPPATSVPAADVGVALHEAAADPDVPVGVGELIIGMAFAKLERWDEAAKAMREGISCFQFALVDVLTRLGRGEEAVAAFRNALELGTVRPQIAGGGMFARFAQRRERFWTPANLGPEVFRTAQWLERAASGEAPADSGGAGTDEPASTARLLFVLDKDYGELTTIMYLLLGRSLIQNTTLLLPPHLYANSTDALPGRARPYGSVEDVIEWVDREKPDIVFLCSGYLLTIHKIFSLDGLRRLIDLLRDRGCRVVTADPFLGLFSTHDPRALVTIEIPEQTTSVDRDQLLQAKEIQEKRLWTHLSQCAEIFRDVTHLYPARSDAGDTAASNPRGVASFNPVLTRVPLARQEPEEGAAPARPLWLFLLSQTDFDTQTLYETHPGFADIVAARLLDALAAGRHPILIAPKEFIDYLAGRMPTAEGVDLLYHCPFTQIMPILLNAEYVFYWNVLSHTILIRLFNKLPTVVFDKGHLVRNVSKLYERIVERYYQGWEPRFVDHRARLTLAGLAAYTRPYREEADRILESFARAPTPEHLIQHLMTGEARPARAPVDGVQGS